MLDSYNGVAIMAFFAADAKRIAAICSTRTLAQVAELVDALGSGPSGGNTVEVRVLSWAPDVRKSHLRVAFLFYAETVLLIPTSHMTLRLTRCPFPLE
ncbi:protein of unknown function [Caballeronia sp. S22]